MNPKNILYIIGISGVITFLVGALYMFRTVGLDGSMNVWQLGFSLFIIIFFVLSLLCLIIALGISEYEFKKNQKEKILKENEEYYQRMQSL